MELENELTYQNVEMLCASLFKITVDIPEAKGSSQYVQQSFLDYLI